MRLLLLSLIVILALVQARLWLSNEGLREVWRLQAQVAERTEENRRLATRNAALEGEVLTYSEIKAATDRNIISDVSLIPAYEDIKAFDSAARFALEQWMRISEPAFSLTSCSIRLNACSE